MNNEVVRAITGYLVLFVLFLSLLGSCAALSIFIEGHPAPQNPCDVTYGDSLV